MKLKATTSLLVFVSIFFIQCAGKKTPKTELTINNKWELVELTGFSNKIVGPKGAPTIEFKKEDFTYFGHSGCNTYHGEYTKSDVKLTLKPALMTKMACVDDGLETAFIKVLHEVNNFEIETNNLKLKKGSEVLGVFKLTE